MHTHLYAYHRRIYAKILRVSIGLRRRWPPHLSLCSSYAISCSSVQRFAYSFLQTPPREGRPCFRLALPLTGCAGDFNPQYVRPAGRTNNPFHSGLSRNETSGLGVAQTRSLAKLLPLPKVPKDHANACLVHSFVVTCREFE